MQSKAAGERRSIATRDAISPMAMLLTAKDLAAVLQVSVRTLYRLKDQGTLPPQQTIAGSNLARWNRAEIENWVQAGMPSYRTASKDRPAVLRDNAGRTGSDSHHPARRAREADPTGS